MSYTVFLSLGSNLGDREQYLMSAIRMLSGIEGFELVEMSPIYINPAVDMKKDTPAFLNMAIEGRFVYRPLELLNAIESIEQKLGRTGKGQNLPRTIDIDIILFENESIDTDRLTIPHKKMTDRAFVILPLLQINPDLVQPVTGDRLDKYIKPEDAEKLILYKESMKINV
jgi:2-amino-4-hydroxy-6-hydroxymethyldihydropteridine diphosphokinase